MLLGKQKQTGFTIVELLIVIVVIGILAAITIVAYNGIQARAADSVIQGDLRNFANKTEQYNATNGAYPDRTDEALAELEFAASRTAYDNAGNNQYAPNGYNLGYCSNTSTNQFVIYAVSPSSKAFRYRSTDGLQEVTPISGGYPVCGWVAVSSTNPSWGRGLGNDSWRSWVGG